MASKLLGRCTCPICDDDKAHVKIKTDKEEGKTAYPYIHCRECSWQGHTKSRDQAEKLLKKTRPEKIDTPAPTEESISVVKSETAEPISTAVEKPAYTGRFGSRP